MVGFTHPTPMVETRLPTPDGVGAKLLRLP